MSKALFIGIDIGGTKISAGLVDSHGKILFREKDANPRSNDPQDILDVIFDTLNEVINKKNRRHLRGIGIAVPGLVNPRTKKILVTPNTHLSGFPLCQKLEKKFKVKVFLGNDVNLGLLGEKWLGAAKKAHHVVGLFPGTGIGGGIIIDGKLVTGANGLAAELGHMIIEHNGPLCSCGNHGCLEAVAGRWAIERDIRKAIKKGKKTIITKLIRGKIKSIKSKTLKEALKAKDPLTIDILSHAAQVLGQACISIRHILNPEMIILGGGVIEACGEFILPRVKKTAEKDPFFARFDHCKIVSSQLGDDAVILGAVALVMEELQKAHTIKP